MVVSFWLTASCWLSLLRLVVLFRHLQFAATVLDIVATAVRGSDVGSYESSRVVHAGAP
jgi:hypothetical protein